MKSDRIYLGHILESIESILEYTAGMQEDDFHANRLVKDAVIRNFEIVGEATKRISFQLRNENPGIPWTKMAGLRDKLIHEYIRVDLQLVWDVIKDVLPGLVKEIKEISSRL
jgi:uncharacterized protein with HEPN domain